MLGLALRSLIRIIIIISYLGPVAQWLEQGTHNPLVVGSNPTGPTIIINKLCHRHYFMTLFVVLIESLKRKNAHLVMNENKVGAGLGLIAV